MWLVTKLLTQLPGKPPRRGPNLGLPESLLVKGRDICGGSRRVIAVTLGHERRRCTRRAPLTLCSTSRAGKLEDRNPSLAMRSAAIQHHDTVANQGRE